MNFNINYHILQILKEMTNSLTETSRCHARSSYNNFLSDGYLLS